MKPKGTCVSLPGDGYGVVLIPKCASRSMEVALRPDAVSARVPRRIGFIREPLDWLRSFYDFSAVVNRKSFNRIARTTTYQDMVDAILENEKNLHWELQSSYDVTEWHLFEDLASVWPTLYPNHPLTLDQWVGRSRSPAPGRQAGYRRNELLAFFAADVAIRDSLSKARK